MPDTLLSMTQTDGDALARQIFEAAFVVHSTLGAGLREPAYARCLAYELETRGLQIARDVPAPIIYRNIRVDAGLAVALVVEGTIAVEVRAVERLLPSHDVPLLTYLKFSGHDLGLLINFNVPLIKQGIRTLLRQPYYYPPSLLEEKEKGSLLF